MKPQVRPEALSQIGQDTPVPTSLRPSDRSCLRRGCTRLAGQRGHNHSMDLERISVDHQIMGGVPCVRGTRIPVATVVGLIAHGYTSEDVLRDYPQLTEEDVRACLLYAARAVDDRELPVRLTA
jgi:uncharacterized protein (DUF433 family)